MILNRVGQLALALFISCSAKAEHSPEALMRDADLLNRALTTLHPGLYLHQSPAGFVDSNLALRRAWSSSQKTEAVYLSLARHLSNIRCGHTYANFFNQTSPELSKIFNRADKVPFTFDIIEGRMLVVSGEEIPSGAEVTKINRTPIGSLVRTILPYVKGDGYQDAKRVSSLSVSGLGRFETFDVFQPLLLPPDRGQYEIEFRRADDRRVFRKRVNAVSRQQRLERLKLVPPPPWEFDVNVNRVATLTLRTFTVWNFDFDWRAFLNDAFARARAEAPEDLIIDIRENEGGSDEVLLALAPKILTKSISSPSTPAFVSYRKVPPDLRPFLQSWNAQNFDISDRVESFKDGLYKLRPEATGGTIGPFDGAYPGRIWLLVGPTNSSATHYLAKIFADNKLGRLVGRTTGGSQLGMQGGEFFILTLPETGITVDIPLIANRSDKPDEGIRPDVLVRHTFAAAAKGIDQDKVAVMQLISRIRAE